MSDTTEELWITKYALTKGIERVLCNFNPDCPGLARPVNAQSFVRYHGEGRDWHRNRESAIVRAEQMRAKAITGLTRRINKLKKIKFT